MKIRPQPDPPSRRIVLRSLLAGAALLLGGCATVPPIEQAYLSKPNMLFEDALVYNAEPRFQGSFEPGSPNASGASATGCAACR